MADFRIWGRCEQIAPEHFVCIVSAVPWAGDDAEVFTRSATSLVAAHQEVEAMAVEIGAMIRARGDRVVDVETF